MPTPPPAPVDPPGRQQCLPFFPLEGKMLGEEISVMKRDDIVWYFHFSMPVYSHREDDQASFRVFTSLLCDNGHCKLMDVHRVFGVTEISVKRALKRYRTEGPKSFYVSHQPEVKPRVLTPEVHARAQALLDAGFTMRAVGIQIGVKEDTIRFAVRDGRLHRPVKIKDPDGTAAIVPETTKSARSATDHTTVDNLGVACHDVLGRTMAAIGKGGPAQPTFVEAAIDVPYAGVMCALPALLSNGLLEGVERHFPQPKGYYPLSALVMLFAFLSLARIRTIEKAGRLEPGEWGQLLGLDRMPEVRTMRRKLAVITESGDPAAYAKDMSVFWMQGDEHLAGTLYVDGHVRTYYGSQTVLPRRHSSRDRLCMRSMMDYWVNDMNGTPFFVLSVVGTEGMIHYLRTTLIPRLLQDVPNQLSDAELELQKDRHRFSIVVDREGYSPKFFAELWINHRIAILTYYRGEVTPWPISDFTEQEVVSPFGKRSLMLLAEHAIVLPGAKNIQIREIRCLSKDHTHQTPILATDRLTPMPVLAAHMFARWDQENFFKYAMREFAIDHLPGHGLAPAPDTETLRNPAYNQVENDLRRARVEHADILRKRGALVLTEMPEAKTVEDYCQQMALLHKATTDLDQKMADLRTLRKNTPKRINISDLPEDKRPKIIAHLRLQFLNTIHITAYRAETRMAEILREHSSKPDEVRALLQTLYKHAGDIIPDHKAKTLTVRLHHFANARTSRAIAALLSILNETETIYPGTNLTMRYELVSPPSPPNPEV